VRPLWFPRSESRHFWALVQSLSIVMRERNGLGKALCQLLGSLIVSIVVLLPSTSSAQPVFASVLPTSRSVQVGTTATAFATIINAGAGTVTGCSLAPLTSVPATFTYQTTNPLTNALTGTLNTPVDIAAGKNQTFVFAFTPTAAFAPTDVQLRFACANAAPVTVITGVNTLLLSASTTPVPDMIALAATMTQDGIANVDPNARVGVLAVATSNVGSSGAITVTANTGGVNLPLNLSVCETNPTTGRVWQRQVPASRRRSTPMPPPRLGSSSLGTTPSPLTRRRTGFLSALRVRMGSPAAPRVSPRGQVSPSHPHRPRSSLLPIEKPSPMVVLLSTQIRRSLGIPRLQS
jgi:hypothetical protein